MRPATALSRSGRAHRQEVDVAFVARAPAAGGVPRKVLPGVDGLGARGREFVAKTRQKPLRDPLPAGEQGMQMAALRHALARQRVCRQRVALDDRDAREGRRERSCGEKAGHAAAENHGMAERTTRVARSLTVAHDRASGSGTGSVG